MSTHSLPLDEVPSDAEARLTAAQAQFSADGVYLNSATVGLPCRATLEALTAALEGWRSGAANAADYDLPLAASRRAYAGLVGIEVGRVAVGNQASVFAGLVAAALPDGSEVLTATGDFTSVVFPFLAQARRGVRVREVPLDRLAESVTPSTALLAVSAVQSADGRLADLGAIEQACAATGTRIYLDTTQAAGWLPIDASRYTYTVCSGYKWLLAPRGTAFFTVADAAADDLIPHHAGWYAGDQPWNSIYGSPLRLAADARRFDISPAWHSWVGQAPALELLTQVGVATLHQHAVGLANRLRLALDLPPCDSAIVSLGVDEGGVAQLAAAQITAAFRNGRLRLSFHLNNTHDDADRAAEALSGHLTPAETP